MRAHCPPRYVWEWARPKEEPGLRAWKVVSHRPDGMAIEYGWNEADGVDSPQGALAATFSAESEVLGDGVKIALHASEYSVQICAEISPN